MSRKLATAALVVLLALHAFAKDRAVAPKEDDVRVKLGGGASVTGEVSAVTGNVIALAGGLVTIDATNAKILSGENASTLSAIKPGMLIAATLNDTTTTANAPLVATAIAILRSADVTLTGTVQAVDVAGNQFTLLGKSIKVNSATSYVNGTNLGSVQSNMVVIVEANAVNGALVASRVTLIAPIPPRPQAASGVVKSIGSASWVVTVRERDTTFVVNASTKILGEPKVGDKVEIVYTVDTANANVALSIIKSVVVEVPKLVHFTGVVKSIASRQWVITRDDDHKDAVVKWPDTVILVPAVVVGDHVDVTAIQNADGTYTLVMILPKR